MIAAIGARNLSQVDAGVVDALMTARYQNSGRSQFISEDPLFVGGPMPDLANPQNQNSYSYSNDNPITKSDPSGLLVSEYQPYLPSGSDYKRG